MLANLPWRRGKLYGIRAGSRWPFMMEPEPGRKIPGYMPFPFFLAYAAALLEKNGFEVKLVDALAEGMTDGEFMLSAESFGPEAILVETSTPSINNDLLWAKKLKDKFPKSMLCLSGPHATVFAAELLAENDFLDAVFRGEYEHSFLAACRAAERKEGFSGIGGMAYRENGRIIVNQRVELFEDLDSMPWPLRSQLPMLNYNDSFSGLPSPNVQVWASRGCPFGCVFCNWPSTMYGGKNYRTRNPVDVANEVEWLVKTYGFKAFYFDDDTFNIGKERITALCAEIKGKNLGVPWAAMARADTSDLETLKAMREAGLYAVKFGVESGCQDIVDRSGKGLNLEKVRENVRNAKRLGIKTHLTFTFGLPGETEGTIRETVKFAKALDPDSAQFSIVTPFPGTPYFKELDEKGLIVSRNWDDYDGANRAVIRTENLSDTALVSMLRYAEREWYRHQLFSRLMKKPLRSLINGIKKPDYALLFLKKLFRR